MAKLLITATHGDDNSTGAALPFYLARGAKESGIDVDHEIPVYVRGR